MIDKEDVSPPAEDGARGEKNGGAGEVGLPPAARRALAEAEARRAAVARKKPAPAEVGGPDGPEPTRFGDWEVGGIASDF